ncbi:efflux RND transporter permease subunit [Sporosarcina sp. G11-34]|uniref:efflux RND transporter permease subunit n=1 Tax=Sporosarcina sp. G11-34 TaxID=2849605 RepID=UPI0022A915D8|nr:efflux RND transporter permease subunit [Sporosarcina sp. G11-34]MCZ2257188.1 efflux RND transporter permease subunit [Sporosarcina sp. G11-34]
MKISNFSIKRPVFTIMLMFLVIILGAVSFFRIPVTLIPELNPPVAIVVTSYPGASPTEVNEKVTKPLEDSLSTAPGLKTIQSSSEEGANFVLMMFDWSTNIDDVQLDIMQRMDQVPMPDGANKPRLLKFDPAQFPVIQLSLNATDNEADIRVIAEQLEQELRRTKGVASVTVSGELVEEVKITLDEKKLEENGLAQEDIVQLIQSNNVSMPGEPIETDGGKQLTTRIISMLTSVDDIRDLTIMENPLDGKKLKIGDVGKVDLAEVDSPTETRANDKPAVLMSVLQESGANTADVSASFKEALDDLLQTEKYEQIETNILFDQGDYVKLAIGNIGQSLILGGIFAMIVLFFFLRGIKSPIIIGIAIPYSVIVTFVLMYFAEFSLNIMTLGALALGIGMLVDNSIVVIENIERHLAMGKEPKKAASEGSKEVGGAIIASTLTTLAVFVPVIFISGLIGEIFTEFALTISFSLFASLVVALTVVPMMAAHMLKKPKGNNEAKLRRSKSLNRFERSVRWALRNRIAVLLITAVLIVISGFGLSKVGTEFLPATDEGFVSIGIELPNGSSPKSTDEVVKRIEGELKEHDDVEVYVSLIGGTQQSLSQGSSEANRAELSVKLVPLADRTRSVFEFVDDVQPKVLKLVGEDAVISFDMQNASGSTPNTLTFSLNDTNEKRLNEAVTDLNKELEGLSTVQEVSNSLGNTVEEIRIEVNREKAAEYGLAPYQIAQTVTDITRGEFATQIIGENEEVLGVMVQYAKQYRDSTNQLKKLRLRTQDGQFIALGDVAKIEIAEGPVSIQRVDQAHSVTFDVKYKSTESLGQMTKTVNDLLDSMTLSEEIEVSFGGDRELFESAIDDMLLALVLAVVLVYIVMAAQFESFKYPLVIMFSVPLMIIGVAIGLFVTNTPISVTAIIGILVLVGIVVNNGIVLVDYINQRKAAGLSSFDAIVSSVRDRVRPILMTALTTILGLLPLALGLGEGTEMNQPMGIAVIGGLISSTFLTLYIIPVIYSLFDRQTRKRARPRRR